MEDLRKMKVAVYCRFATKEQDTTAYHIDQMKRYVADHPNWELVSVYCDYCPSARLSQRVGYAQLLRAVRNGEVALVAIPKPSMLGRGTTHYHNLLAKLTETGAAVDFADGTPAKEISDLIRLFRAFGG